MKSLPQLRRVFSLAGTVLVFAAVLVVLALQAPSRNASVQADAGKEDARRNWPLFGGSVSRDLVNLAEKDMPTQWQVGKKEKNIKWSVRLGNKAYGGPIVAGGKIYVGTNNGGRRDPNVKGDKGIMMCFRESDGEFLWQAVHDKLLAGRVNDWPEEGICSSPVVEGDRLYYVSNRCEVICADVEGMANGNQGVTDETYKGPKDADILWRLDMIGRLGVFPHNLAVCSPLVVGDTSVRHHGQWRGRGPHRHPQARSAQLLGHQQEERRGAVERQRPDAEPGRGAEGRRRKWTSKSSSTRASC